MADVLAQLGVRRWVNGAGYLTRLGGSVVCAEAQAAMQAVAGAFLDLAELQAAANAIIARHTGAEAGIVTSGAAAALTLATAACLAGLDAARMDRLPDTTGMPDEVVMPRIHRSSYDHAIRAAGARIREVGVNDQAMNAGMRGLDRWEIEAAITERTAALALMGSPHTLRDLETMVAVAEAHRLPVIVDAAPWLPPVSNLRLFIDAGASLVAFSGGKAIRGPQSTGILCGRKDLVVSALLQQMDMNVDETSWTPPVSLIPRERLTGVPRHGIGRGMKVGKESIVGLIVALERFVERDHAQDLRDMERILAAIADGISELPHVSADPVPAAVTGRRPILRVRFDEKALGKTAAHVSAALQAGTPPIQLTERFVGEGMLIVDPAVLGDADVAPIVAGLKAAI